MAEVLGVGVAQKPKDKYERWIDNYSRTRAFTNFLFDKLQYKVDVEGELPKEGPRVLALPHQNSLDAPSLMRGISEYIAFVYSADEIKKTTALKVIPYHIGGVRVKKHHVYFKRFFEHLDKNSLVAVFPQGKFEDHIITAFKSGIAELVQIYEQKRKREVAIMSAGIEYKSPRYLPKTSPVPGVKLPTPGTKAIIRFGNPHHLNGRCPKELTEIVMQEAARLSRLKYVVN